MIRNDRLNARPLRGQKHQILPVRIPPHGLGVQTRRSSRSRQAGSHPALAQSDFIIVASSGSAEVKLFIRRSVAMISLRVFSPAEPMSVVMRQTVEMRISALLLVMATVLGACGPARDEPTEQPATPDTTPARVTSDSSTESPASTSVVRAPLDEEAEPDAETSGETADSDVPTTVTSIAETSIEDGFPPKPKYPDPEFEIPPPRD